MNIHKFLTATTVACPQARTSIPSTAGPLTRLLGRRVAGSGTAAGTAGFGVSWRRPPFDGGRG